MSLSLLAGIVLFSGALILRARRDRATMPVLARSHRQRRRDRRHNSPA